ncbi:YjbQ family protein [Cyanobacterium stanieri LEGE 03274]|uniref:YjbQ family protein n=1 Tax=Cyanobacterium stanieri LEGE 03274 TaxID=1828756 RepID=A0ABR9V600_9CHRO|nr:secondary thiamine-phosphate synthase enzyme YjbQ [Cyanobacterium stanieri]MBE9223320.1 YjbQ family protein [Cyanobacterium stanieri LEGE 03274]
MVCHQNILKIKTSGKCLHNITRDVNDVVAQWGMDMGLCTVFIRHTSASLIIQENADPDVLTDLSNFFSKLVPESPTDYYHSAEGLDDMPSHIRSVLTHTSITIPVNNGHLLLGTWQGIYVWEHRERSHLRQVVVHLNS